jgi:hypothetical protein
MLVTEIATERQDDLIDEFDLDIRISVLSTSDINAGFSTWQTCKTCKTTCTAPNGCKLTGTRMC